MASRNGKADFVNRFDQWMPSAEQMNGFGNGWMGESPILFLKMIDQKQKTSFELTRFDFLTAALVWLAAFALYVRTLAPSLLWGDSAEFQTLSYTLGMTHPSGYMTHIMIGKLFTLIPVGNIAYRVNLMSAFFGALAVAEIYLIVRLLNGRKAAALSASALLALLEGFWWRALIAESYATAAGMIASIWLFVLLWNRSQKWQYLFLAGLLGGLSVGIHSTIVMTGASVLITMAITARTRSAWMGATLGALLGLALTIAAFLYVDHNDPPSSIYNTVYRTSLSARGLTESQFDTPFERLFAIFPANHFWSYYFSATPDVMRFRLAEYVSYFPIWAWILIAVGIVAVFFRSRWFDGLYPLVGFLLIWGLAVTVSFSIYREFYVPASVFVAAWFGAGASASLDGLERLVSRIQPRGGRMRRVIIGAAALTLVALPVWNARVNVQLAVEKGYTEFIQRDHIYPVFAPDKAIKDAQKLLARVEENAIVFADWDKLYSYVYTAEIEDGRMGISFHEAITDDNGRLPDSTIAYIEANIDSRPIYFTVMLDELNELYAVEQVGDSLFRIRRK
jgi:hypothetical protein